MYLGLGNPKEMIPSHDEDIAVTTSPCVVRCLNSHQLKLPDDLDGQRIFTEVLIQLAVVSQRIIAKFKYILERDETVLMGVGEMVGDPVAITDRFHQGLDVG